jgi:hypothetical protein
MDIKTVSNEKTVFVIGAPRSGTTWLGKLFDSNPTVLYRHEPDTVLRDRELQGVFTADQYAAHREHAAAYIDTLIGARVLKASGTFPVFRKSYRSPLQHTLRLGMIAALRATEKLSGDAQSVRRLQIPDMVDPALASDIRVVIKSNISRGRIGLFAVARPGARFLFLIRDPFGQVASMLRGIQLGKFERNVRAAECLDTPQAQQYGLTPSLFEKLPAVEQHAWHWALLNEKALDDLKSVPDTMVLRYRDLVASPEVTVREAFAFAGISWQEQTARFLRESTTAAVSDRYYQIYKNSTDSLNKWRKQLSIDEQRRIVQTLTGTATWQLYPELHDLIK